METSVVILAPATDMNASALQWALQLNGIEVVWASSLKLGDSSRCSIVAGRKGMQIASSLLNVNAVKSIWLRDVQQPELYGVANEDRAFVRVQWLHFQKNILNLPGLFGSALWVNDPAACKAAQSKIVQLRAAYETGLAVPETIISNDAGMVKDLLEREGKLVFKQFQGGRWKSAVTGELYSSDPVLLEKDSELPEEAIAICPGIYQQYIDKLFDVRVTVIGERMFPVRFWRKDHTAYLDWRPHIYDEDMLVEEFPLSCAAESKLRSLMRKLGLVYGCIDLVVDREGAMYFLEVNQQGQFLFVEEALPHMQVLQAMTSLLMQGRVDYSMDASTALHFSGYLLSEDYQIMSRRPGEPLETYAIEA